MWRESGTLTNMRDPSAVNSNPSGWPVSAIGAKAVIAKFGYVQPVAGYIQHQMIDAADHRTQVDLRDQLESVYRRAHNPVLPNTKPSPSATRAATWMQVRRVGLMGFMRSP